MSYSIYNPDDLYIKARRKHTTLRASDRTVAPNPEGWTLFLFLAAVGLALFSLAVLTALAQGAPPQAPPTRPHPSVAKAPPQAPPCDGEVCGTWTYGDPNKTGRMRWYRYKQQAPVVATVVRPFGQPLLAAGTTPGTAAPPAAGASTPWPAAGLSPAPTFIAAHGAGRRGGTSHPCPPGG